MMEKPDYPKEAFLSKLALADAYERAGGCSIEDRVDYLERQVNALRGMVIEIVCGEMAR